VKPKTNSSFWAKKLSANADRDRRNDEALAGLGWHPIRVWEHEVKENLPGTVKRIAKLVARRSKT